jgi:hypothetical protein
MPSQHLLDAYAAAKAVLRADAWLKSPSGLAWFVWMDEKQGEVRERMGSKGPGELPELRVDLAGGTGGTTRPLTPTFGNVRPGSTCPSVGSDQYEFTLTLVADDTGFARSAEILDNLGRVLNTDATLDVATNVIGRWGQVRWRWELTSAAAAKGHRRRVTTITAPLTVTYTA